MDKFEALIIKFLDRSLSSQEWDELNRYIEENPNLERLDEYVKINYAIDFIMSEFNTEHTKKTLLERIERDKRSSVRKKRFGYIMYAALIALVAGMGILVGQGYFTKDREHKTVFMEKEVTLELEEGDIRILSKAKNLDIIDHKGKVIGVQKGSSLSYVYGKRKAEKLAFNQLSVPNARTFRLKLSDGTSVHLNSGSSLKYPAQFLDLGPREVFLEGEAYLEVAKDTLRPFILKTSNGLMVNVVGTKFNVSNYPEDATTNVVLVEGAVNLESRMSDRVVTLEAGYMGSYDDSTNEISAKPVVTSGYVSWVNGKLVFRNMAISHILKKLERHYDVVIENEDTIFGKRLFNANFGNEPIERILDEFKSNYGVAYNRQGDTITIK